MKNGFEVFDFTEDDELAGKWSGEVLEKFQDPNLDDAILKYKFLERVAQGSDVQKEVGNAPCVDLDELDCDQSFEDARIAKEDDAFSKITQGMVEVGLASKDESKGLDVSNQWNSVTAEENRTVNEDNDEFRNCHSALESGNSCLQNGLVDTASGADDECTNESLPSSPTSEAAEDDGVFLDSRSSYDCSNDFEMEEVVLHPDYVEYLDSHHIAPIIHFSSTGIKIEVSTSDTPFNFQTGIDDIIDIRCHFIETVGMAKIRLHFLSRDMVEADNAHGASGIQEMRFTVLDPCWFEKLQEITSLSVKYSSLWHDALDEETELENSRPLRGKSYLPKFDKPFDEVIYPKGDVDAVSISKRDIDLLQPETFINDTIIDFYIKYLKNQIPPENKHRYHFFNSFFFRKLADLDKDPSSISDGRAAFLRVQKWTRKVDIFGKDYVFIPVNFNLHWSLIVICHPGDVASFKNENLDKAVKVPCILHMDSIKGSHAGLKNLVQRYLWEEWKARHNDVSDDVSSEYLKLRFIPLELPQQENSYDCGLFLLHYLECFLADAPENFNPFKIDKSSNFLNANWFPPSEVSLKRALIQRLIFEVIENHLLEKTSAVCDNHQSSKFRDDDKNEKSLEFVSMKSSSRVAYQGTLPTSEAGQGIQIETSLLQSVSLKNESSSLVLRDLFEPGTSAAPTLGQFSSFVQPSYFHLSDSTAPKLEHVEGGGHYDDVYMPSEENDFPQIIETTPHVDFDSLAYTSGDFDTSWNPEFSFQKKHTIETQPYTSHCSSDDSDDDVGIIENNPLVKISGPNLEQVTDKRSPSMEKLECLKEVPNSPRCEPPITLTTEVLRTADELQDGNNNGDLLFSNLGNLLENSLGQDSAKVEKDEKVQSDEIGNDCLAGLEGQRATKRMRFTSPMGITSEDLHL